MPIITQVQSWDTYKTAWIKCMQHIHWFKTNRLFDYNREEELKELKDDFLEDHIFLMAKSEKDDRILGVLSIKLRGNRGILRRWEPAVLQSEKNRGVGEALIEEGVIRLKERGIQKLDCKLRYPYGLPETGAWHIKLYRRCGFTQKDPEGIMLLLNLSSENKLIYRPLNFGITGCDALTLEDLAAFVLRAYASTPEDRLIHHHDPKVSNYETILKVLCSISEGKMGLSPPECCRIALVEGEPAGFVLVFMPESQYRPPHGIIGYIGVFPEYRRRGIASSLLREMHGTFRKYGRLYSYVGTSMNNKGALELYKKIGYRPVFKIVDFEKELLPSTSQQVVQ